LLSNFRQQEESDCLAACAAMMLRAVNIDLPYSTLLSVLGIKPWGAPHRNILNLAKLSPNISVTYQQGEIPDLRRVLDRGLPPVAFVWTGELPYWSTDVWHAVVLVGYDDQNFYVNDPVFPIPAQPVTVGDFDLAWLAYDSYYAVIEVV